MGVVEGGTYGLVWWVGEQRRRTAGGGVFLGQLERREDRSRTACQPTKAKGSGAQVPKQLQLELQHKQTHHPPLYLINTLLVN